MNNKNDDIPDLHGKTVLIAEDEEINFLFLETILQDTGAKVIRASNGQQAIDLVKDNKQIDLILMDMKMPIIDGYQATREIKKFAPNLPVVAQTAYALGDDKSLCIEAGCDSYLSKPLRKNLLYSTLSDILK